MKTIVVWVSVMLCETLNIHRTGRATAYVCNTLQAWPLGRLTHGTDVKEGASAQEIGAQISYADGPTQLGYRTLSLTGTSESYVDLTVSQPQTSLVDYSFSFHLYLQSLTGTLFHYKGAVPADTPISLFGPYSPVMMDILVELVEGDIVMSVQNARVQTCDTNLQLDKWYYFVFGRNQNHPELKIKVDGVPVTTAIESGPDLTDIGTQFPGTLRIGKSFENNARYFFGRISCVQFDECKAPSTMYDCASAEVALNPARLTDTLRNVSQCRKFSVSSPDTTFANAEDVMQSMTVSDVKECAMNCHRIDGCGSFAIQRGGEMTCSVGVGSPAVVHEVGALLYTEK